jgi:hypothetical protein
MGFEGFLGHQIDSHPQQLGKALFKAHEPHKTNGPREFDKDVDITSSTLLPAHHGTEDADPSDAEFEAQWLAALSNDPDDVVN